MRAKSTSEYIEIEVLRKHPSSYEQQSCGYVGLNDKSKVYAENTDLKILHKYMVTEATIMEENFPRKDYSKRRESRMQFLEISSFKVLILVSQELVCVRFCVEPDKVLQPFHHKPNMSYFFSISLQ